jgi:hypothetical protein
LFVPTWITCWKLGEKNHQFIQINVFHLPWSNWSRNNRPILLLFILYRIFWGLFFYAEIFFVVKTRFFVCLPSSVGTNAGDFFPFVIVDAALLFDCWGSVFSIIMKFLLWKKKEIFCYTASIGLFSMEKLIKCFCFVFINKINSNFTFLNHITYRNPLINILTDPSNV